MLAPQAVERARVSGRPDAVPVKVLHAHSGNLFGGVETVLETLAHDRDVCPSMVPVFATCFDGRLRTSLRTAGCEPYDLGAVRVSRPWQVLRARARLAALLESTRCDVVLLHSMWALAVFGPVLRRRGIPFVVWVHDAVAGRGWIERLGARTRPSLAICNSGFTADRVATALPGVARRTVHPPLRLPPPATPDARRRVRAAQGAPENATIIVQVSRMERWKGHEVLVDALATLADEATWVCWFVGGPQRGAEGAYFQALRDRVDARGLGGRVRFLGERADVPALLGAADVFVQANLDPEPFGLTYVEALAAGLPDLAAAAGGAREIVDERCGRLVPPGDAAACARAVAGLLSDAGLRHRLGAAGVARARELCDPAQQLPALHAALREIA